MLALRVAGTGLGVPPEGASVVLVTLPVSSFIVTLTGKLCSSCGVHHFLAFNVSKGFVSIVGSKGNTSASSAAVSVVDE